MLEIKMSKVMIRHRELSNIAKDALARGVKLCKGEKTQSFSTREAVTASYGNITVCAPDAKSARMDLAERIATCEYPIRASEGLGRSILRDKRIQELTREFTA